MPHDEFESPLDSTHYTPRDMFEQRMLSILEAALDAIKSTDTGWYIETTNLDSLRSCIYTLLRAIAVEGDTRFRDLMITKAPSGDQELWIIHKQATIRGHTNNLPEMKKYLKMKAKEEEEEGTEHVE